MVLYFLHMATFKNTSDNDLEVPGVGMVQAGAQVELPEDFHNANFERVSKSEARRNASLKKSEAEAESEVRD